MNRIETQDSPLAVTRIRKKCGSTLIESLFAIALLATFITGAGTTIVMTHKLSDKAQDHYTAINIAKNQLEQVRNLRRSDYDQILALQETGTRIDETGGPDTHGLFRRTTTITIDSRNDYLIEVSVRVDLLNRISRRFEGEHEELKSYIAHLL